MKMIPVMAALALACACERKPQEPPPVPKDPGSPTPSVAVSTAAPAASPLSAPANYVRRATDQLGKTKAAVSVYEDAAAKRMDPGLGGGMTPAGSGHTGWNGK